MIELSMVFKLGPYSARGRGYMCTDGDGVDEGDTIAADLWFPKPLRTIFPEVLGAKACGQVHDCDSTPPKHCSTCKGRVSAFPRRSIECNVNMGANVMLINFMDCTRRIALLPQSILEV